MFFSFLLSGQFEMESTDCCLHLYSQILGNVEVRFARGGQWLETENHRETRGGCGVTLTVLISQLCVGKHSYH